MQRLSLQPSTAHQKRISCWSLKMNRAVSRVRRAEDENIFVSSPITFERSLLAQDIVDVLWSKLVKSLPVFEKTSVFACLRR